MFAISFRIPVKFMGTLTYVNGSTLYHRAFKVGQTITVVDKNQPSFVAEATVIRSAQSSRGHESFKWGVI